MSNDEKKFQPIFQILHIKSAWFLLELAMALVTTIGMRFLQVCPEKQIAPAIHILYIIKRHLFSINFRNGFTPLHTVGFTEHTSPHHRWPLVD